MHPDAVAIVADYTGFAASLRAAGITIGTGQVTTFCAAVAQLDPSDVRDLYWSGRSCLITRPADIRTYDDVFAATFLPTANPGIEMIVEGVMPRGELTGVDMRGSGTGTNHDDRPEGTSASDFEILREKDFAACTDEELLHLRNLMRQLVVATPRRLTRRTEASSHGMRPDLRAVLRTAARNDGMLIPNRWRKRRTKRRRLILLLDISGSMAQYSRALLQFAHSTRRSQENVEVFCFGTRLTRVTRAIAVTDADRAMAEAAHVVVDWDGGTMIGQSLHTYNREWATRSGFRGGVVVICSDGLERGDPEVLRTEMMRLRRLTHRIVWVNPLKADAAFEPSTRGMAAASPSIDVLVSGHNLARLEELADVIGAFG